MAFAERIPSYLNRIEQALELALPDPKRTPERLHSAMHYAVLGGGKRLRPLLVYACGEALRVSPDVLDAPAVAVELMHAFSLIHDDLPAMDDDDVRRGRPTTHRAFDVTTAILAADALQPLAFEVLVTHPALAETPRVQTQLVALLGEACGPNGIAGGQALDLDAERQGLDSAQMEHLFRLKTGRLLRASILSAAYCGSASTATLHRLELFADALGIVYQIRDDILDFTHRPPGQHTTEPSYPAAFGLEKAQDRAARLLEKGLLAIADLDAAADGLRWMARYTLLRNE